MSLSDRVVVADVPMPPDFRYTECEPMPVAVPRGTAQIFTQSLLHSPWVNSDTEPRKAFVVSWLPRAVPIGWDSHSQLDALRDQFPRFKVILPPAPAVSNEGRDLGS